MSKIAEDPEQAEMFGSVYGRPKRARKPRPAAAPLGLTLHPDGTLSIAGDFLGSAEATRAYDALCRKCFTRIERRRFVKVGESHYHADCAKAI
jgi:hypothetical protein